MVCVNILLYDGKKTILLFLSGDAVAGLEDRINSLEAELTSKMESDLAETTASVDLLRCDCDHQCKDSIMCSVHFDIFLQGGIARKDK